MKLGLKGCIGTPCRGYRAREGPIQKTFVYAFHWPNRHLMHELGLNGHNSSNLQDCWAQWKACVSMEVFQASLNSLLKPTGCKRLKSTRGVESCVPGSFIIFHSSDKVEKDLGDVIRELALMGKVRLTG